MIHLSCSDSTRQTSAKTTGQSNIKTAKPTTYVRRGFSQNLNLDRHNLRPNPAARSAPSSPALSPPRSPPLFVGWPTLEPGIHRPKSPRSITVSLHHHRLAMDSPSACAHPLPLPPGPQLMFQPSAAYNKPSMPCSRDQWLKGNLIGRGTFGSVYIATNR